MPCQLDYKTGTIRGNTLEMSKNLKFSWENPKNAQIVLKNLVESDQPPHRRIQKNPKEPIENPKQFFRFSKNPPVLKESFLKFRIFFPFFFWNLKRILKKPREFFKMSKKSKKFLKQSIEIERIPWSFVGGIPLNLFQWRGPTEGRKYIYLD